MEGPPGKILKTALHHWWPQSLSQFWADDDGCVTQLWWDAKEVRQQPGKFGAIKNAHHLKFAESSPWNGSFEQSFDAADSSFPDFAIWLKTLQPRHSRQKALASRFSAHELPRDRRSQMAECLASLIVRSPRSRNNIRITVEPYRVGLPDPKADKTLIAANMAHSQRAFQRAIVQGGKFVALFGGEQEFIFGDGFLHDFPVVPDHIYSRRFIIPILPTVSMMFFQPTFYRTQPELTSLLLTPKEVEFFNQVVQIYSCDFIFYRKDRPRIADYLARHEFLQLEYHDDPFISSLMAGALEFNA